MTNNPEDTSASLTDENSRGEEEISTIDKKLGTKVVNGNVGNNEFPPLDKKGIPKSETIGAISSLTNVAVTQQSNFANEIPKENGNMCRKCGHYKEQ